MKFYVHPFDIALEHSDEEYLDDDETEPPYPSYGSNRCLEEQAKIQKEREHRKKAFQSSSRILPGVC
jgi:hypothetical protein